MATELKHTVKPSGGDFTSLDAAIDHLVSSHADLVSADVYADIEIDGTWSSADTTKVTIDGLTTDATRYLNIYTTATARHSGSWDTGAYNLSLSQTYDGVITCTEDYVRIFGLQVDNTGSKASGSRGIYVTTGDNTNTDIRIAYNIVKLSGTGTPNNSNAVQFSADVNIAIWNNIVYDAGNNGIRLGYYGNSANVSLYNNTVYGCAGIGIYFGGGGGTVRLYNNLCNGNGTDYTVKDVDASGTNISEDDTSPDAAFQGLAVTFSNEGADDFHLGATDTAALNAGTSDPGSGLFSDDIDGDTRSAWDIGADEYVAEEPAGEYRPIYHNHYQQMRTV